MQNIPFLCLAPFLCFAPFFLVGIFLMSAMGYIKNGKSK